MVFREEKSSRTIQLCCNRCRIPGLCMLKMGPEEKDLDLVHFMLLNIMFPFFVCSFDESSSKIKEGGVFTGPSTHGAGSPTNPAVVAI